MARWAVGDTNAKPVFKMIFATLSVDRRSPTLHKEYWSRNSVSHLCVKCRYVLPVLAWLFWVWLSCFDFCHQDSNYVTKENQVYLKTKAQSFITIYFKTNDFKSNAIEFKYYKLVNLWVILFKIILMEFQKSYIRFTLNFGIFIKCRTG